MAKLAELLLRRKELAMKVDQIQRIQQPALYEIKVERKPVTEGIDNIVAQIPKVTLAEVTAEYDFYASALRHVDAAVQQANWTCEVEIKDKYMENYKVVE